MEKSAFLHEMLNIGPTLSRHWYNIIICNRVDRKLILVPTRLAQYWLGLFTCVDGQNV